MRLFRMGWIWGVVYVIMALPAALYCLLVSAENVLGFGDSWAHLLSQNTLEAVEVLLFPFFLALFIAAVVLHRRDRRASPPHTPPLGIPMPVWVIVWVVGLTIVAESGDAASAMPAEQKRELAATGCVNYPRDASAPLSGNYYVVVYDRRCPVAPKYTVNVSVMDSLIPVGPGNAFVVEAVDTSYASAQKLEVFAFVPPKRRELQIFFDRPSHVLSHTSPVHGLVISLPPDSLRGQY